MNNVIAALIFAASLFGPFWVGSFLPDDLEWWVFPVLILLLTWLVLGCVFAVLMAYDGINEGEER